MSLPGQPWVWSPHGACDTLDASTAPRGAMQNLTNLIPDPTTRDLWQCRPAATLLTSFPGFTSPTFISVIKIVGNFAYGTVSSGRNAGKDEPFCYNIVTNTFITITGITAANTPFSPATTGAWNPPSMALVGAKIIVAHPGFNGAGGAFFGVIDITNPNAPVWSATNTSPTMLVAPPTWVVNFNGRCFYLVNPAGFQPAAYMSDSLNPTVITNANQILTFGDNVPLTVAAGLALQNQLGGVIQSLMIFKGVTNIYQVTGDYAFQTLAINTLNVATGTFAPNTVCSSEKGLLFMAPDGVRLITFDGLVGDPIGKDGQGITVPFIYAIQPSRANASFNAGIYRIQVQNGSVPQTPQQEWWYDFVRDLWSGPHTTAVALGDVYSNTFILTLQGAGAKLFQGDVQQSNTSSFVENGIALMWVYTTSMLPDTDEMCEYSAIESTLYLQIPPSIHAGSLNPWQAGFGSGFGAGIAGDPGTLSITFMDQTGTILDTLFLQSKGAGTLWGNFNWGQALWGGAVSGLFPSRLSWHLPLVFRRGQFQATSLCANQLKIGALRMRVQSLGYLQMTS